MTAELGCVTPYIVCPGQWSQADLDYHAGTVVAGMTHNAGHNCLKAEVLLLDKDWPQREAFLTALRYSNVCGGAALLCPTGKPILSHPWAFNQTMPKGVIFFSALCGCWHESQCQTQLPKDCTFIHGAETIICRPTACSLQPKQRLVVSHIPVFTVYLIYSKTHMLCVLFNTV